MSFFALSALFNTIIAFGFGIFILIRNQKALANRIFFLLTLAIFFWGGSYWMWLTRTTEAEALLWVRLLSIGSIFIPPLFFHWVSLLLNVEQSKKFMIYGGYVLATFFSIFSFSDLFIKGITKKLDFAFWPVPGILYHFYLAILYVGMLVYAMILIFERYLQATKQERSKLFYVLLGSFLGFIGGATNFFLWYDIPILPYGNILVGFFTVLLSYATLKHKLFNVRILSTELITFTLWAFLIIQILLAETWQQQLVSLLLLIFIVILGTLLIRSVVHEFEQRMKLEKLTVELISANKKLHQLDQAKSEFISIASHQFRTPLTAIKGYISLIQEGVLKPDSPKALQVFKTLSGTTHQLIKLVDTMLNLSRIEAGKIQYKFSQGKIDEVIRSVIKELAPMADRKKVKVVFINKYTDTPVFYFDVDKIKEVIINLIDNAIKYSPEEATVTVTLEPKNLDGGFVRISVEDKGIGIANKDFNKLFTKFGRSEEAKRVDPNGTGLGLYFAKSVVEAHGGRVGVESKGLGKGAMFWVELPLRPKRNA